MWKVYGDLQKLNAHSIQVWRGLMGINAWNTFVLKVESLHCQKSLDMGEPTFHAETTACYQLQQQTKVHVLTFSVSTANYSGKLHKKHRIRRFHFTSSDCSLVPRLPRSGMQTLKFCRRGEPGIFCHVKSTKDRREVDTTLIVHGRMRLRTEKGTEVAGNFLHVSSYRASNIIHTER